MRSSFRGENKTVRRAGFTLLELSIATCVFVVLLAGLLQVAISLREFVDYDSVAHDLDLEGKRLLKEISNDLSNSARMYVGGLTKYPVLYKTPVDAKTNWDELEFVRLRTERTISAIPRQRSFATVNFGDDNPPIPFSRYVEAKPVNSLVLDPDATLGAELDQIADVAWETDKSGLNFEANANPENVRVFRYELEDDLQTGRKKLYRKYKNPGDTEWSIDMELAANIVSFTVDMAESMPSLAANEVHISISFQRSGSASDTKMARSFEGTIALRNLSSVH
jgi:hypothetical protein